MATVNGPLCSTFSTSVVVLWLDNLVLHGFIKHHTIANLEVASHTIVKRGRNKQSQDTRGSERVKPTQWWIQTLLQEERQEAVKEYEIRGVDMAEECRSSGSQKVSHRFINRTSDVPECQHASFTQWWHKVWGGRISHYLPWRGPRLSSSTRDNPIHIIKTWTQHQR